MEVQGVAAYFMLCLARASFHESQSNREARSNSLLRALVIADREATRAWATVATHHPLLPCGDKNACLLIIQYTAA